VCVLMGRMCACACACVCIVHVLGWPEPYIYMYVRCIYGILSRLITIHTVTYGVHIRFWPALCMWLPHAAAKCRPTGGLVLSNVA